MLLLLLSQHRRLQTGVAVSYRCAGRIEGEGVSARAGCVVGLQGLELLLLLLDKVGVLLGGQQGGGGGQDLALGEGSRLVELGGDWGGVLGHEAGGQDLAVVVWQQGGRG